MFLAPATGLMRWWWQCIRKAHVRRRRFIVHLVHSRFVRLQIFCSRRSHLNVSYKIPSIYVGAKPMEIQGNEWMRKVCKTLTKESRKCWEKFHQGQCALNDDNWAFLYFSLQSVSFQIPQEDNPSVHSVWFSYLSPHPGFTFQRCAVLVVTGDDSGRIEEG